MRPPSPCRPYPTSPKDACRAGRRTGEAASAAGQYPQCPGSIGPSGAAIVLPGLRRWTPPYPQCPRRTHLGPAAQLRRRLQRWGDTATAPGRRSHPGQRPYWECAGVEASPHPGSYPQCPRRMRLGPALVSRDGCDLGALPPQCRGAGPHPGQRSYWTGADRGAPHHPGHTRSAPEKAAPWNADQLGGRDGSGESGAAMAFAVAASAIYERPGPCHTLDAPGLLGRPVGGTDTCRCGG